jgi:hypothetical protein
LPELWVLPLVVIEEHTGRAVQLADDDALGPVDDERAVLGHQRDLAEVDLLLLDVADRLGAPVSSLTSHTTRRIITLIGAAKVMPRW